MIDYLSDVLATDDPFVLGFVIWYLSMASLYVGIKVVNLVSRHEDS